MLVIFYCFVVVNVPITKYFISRNNSDRLAAANIYLPVLNCINWLAIGRRNIYTEMKGFTSGFVNVLAAREPWIVKIPTDSVLLAKRFDRPTITFDSRNVCG